MANKPKYEIRGDNKYDSEHSGRHYGLVSSGGETADFDGYDTVAADGAVWMTLQTLVELIKNDRVELRCANIDVEGNLVSCKPKW